MGKLKIEKIKIEVKKEKKKMDTQRVAKAFSLSFIRGKSILKVYIVGFILMYYNERIIKIGFLKRKKILEIN